MVVIAKSNPVLRVDDFFKQNFLTPNPNYFRIKYRNDSKFKTSNDLCSFRSWGFKKGSKTINISNLKGGTYMIKIEDENGLVSTKQFVKN